MKSFFNLTKNERKGVFLFSIFLVLIFCGKMFFQKESASFLQVSPDKAQIYAQNPRAQVKNSKFQAFKTKEQKKQIITIPDTLFNPNEFTHKDWMAMGFSEKQAGVFCNYLNKIGGLKSADDILKVYGVPLEQLEQLKWKIHIINRKQNVNQMSSEQFIALKGIGEVLALRILKYRESLGGFYSLEQIKEVYGLKPEVMDEIKKNCFVHSSDIKKIKINSLSYDELKTHPYIKEKELKKIIQQRSERPFSDINQLFYLISDSARLDKLKAYLKYE